MTDRVIIKIHKEKNRGFSLIEVLVSFAIFSLIIGGMTLFSVRTIQAHTRSQAMQNSLENSRLAIEELSKKLRTSNNVQGIDYSSGGGNTIFIKSNLDDPSADGYCYRFNATEYELEFASSVSDFSGCNGAIYSSLVGDGNKKIKVQGKFYVKSTEYDTSTPPKQTKRGMVTISIVLEYTGGMSGDPSQNDTASVQSTVSLRDYGY